MACELKTEAYVPIVKQLFKLDSQKYKNFDNVVEFIYNGPIKLENKKLAIHNIAHIYQNLHGLDNTAYELGKAAEVIQMVVDYDQTEKYLTGVQKLYDLKPFKVATMSNIEKMLEKVGNQKSILTSDIEDYVNLVKNHITSTKYQDLQERSDALQSFKDPFYELISNWGVDQNIKDIYHNMLNGLFDKLAINSNYIPLSSVQELAELDNYLFSLTNGTMAEGFIENDRYYIVDPADQTARMEIARESILSMKKARPADINPNTTGKHVFFSDFFNSGFTISAVTPEEEEDLMKELNSLENPMSQVTIHAVQLSNIGDSRVDKMKQLAFADENFANLRNRNHETFESVSQQELLKSKADAKVVTVARPKRNEAEFALVGTIAGTGRRFYIYSVDNFAFVDANNKTELVDFENEAHLKDLQNMSVKQTGSEQVELTEADMNFVKSSHKSYQELKREAAKELETALENGQNSVDVSNLFYHRYSINNTRPTKDTVTVLSKAIETNPQYGKEVTVVTRDANNNITSEKTMVLPFVYYQDIDFGTKQVTFKQTTYLAENELIKYEVNGRTVYLSEEAYAKEVLLLDDKIESYFGKQKAKIIEALNKGVSLKNINKIGRFLVKFGENDNISFAIARTKHQLESDEHFANFAMSFLNALNADVLDDGLKKLFNSFQLAPIGGVLSFNIASSTFKKVAGKELKEKNPQIEFRPYSKNDRYKNAILGNDNKNLFNFELNKEDLKKILDKFTSPILLQRIVNENPSLKSFDLNNASDRVNFFKTVFEMLDDVDATPSVKEFVSNFKNAKQEFTDYIVNRVNKQLSMPNDELQERYKEFKELVKEDLKLNSIDDVTAEQLLTLKDEEGNIFLKINSPTNSEARNLFNRSLKNVAVVTNESRKQFTISSKTTLTKEEASPAILTPQEQQIVNEVREEENTPDNTGFADEVVVKEETQTEETEDNVTDEFDEDDGIEIAPFQLLGETYERASEQDLITEANWLENALPQIGLSKDSIKDIIDLTKIDGNVLGLFLNKMIYLNDKMTSKGIIYHEAFHGVFRYLMTQAERDELVKAVMDDPKHASKFTTDAVYEFGRKRNYTENNYDALARLVAEEILADGFQNYMLKKKTTEPKTRLQKFFDMLKKLLQYFIKNKNIIEHTYSKINTGGFKSRVYQSKIFDGKAAFELIPVQTVRTKSPDGKTLLSKNVTLNTYEQSQLINIINAQIFSDNVENETYDAKFEKAVESLLKDVISVDKLVAQNPSKKDAILNSEWAKLFSKYRFVLGGRLKGLPVFDINLTGDSAADKLKTKLNVLTSEGAVDNSRGEHSLELLKKLSKQAYDKANTIDIVREEQSDVVNSEELENVLNGENATQITDEEATSAMDELENNNFEDGYGQANPIDSYVKQVRRYFATIRNDYEDKELGIKIPRVIDGNLIFPSMLKLSANIQPSQIIQTIGIMAEKMISDGYIQEGSDMKAIYDDIVLKTGYDKTIGRPTKNYQLYNVLTDALHGVELNYLFFTHNLPKQIDENTPDQEILQNMNKQLEFGLYDKVSDTDNATKRDKIVSEFAKAFKQNASKPEYADAINKIIVLIDKIATNKNFLNSIKTQSVILKEYTDEFDNLFKVIGFKIPKSLIQLSLATIYVQENKQFNELDANDNLFLDLNKNFTSQGQYLELDFFKSFKEILRSAYTDANVPNRSFTKRLDDKTKNLDDKRFLLILKKASAYISKYDPTSLPSVIKNAEGKSIYRYAKVNPLQTLAQRLKVMNLNDAIGNDPYYTQVRDYLLDNPLFAPLLTDPDSEEAQKARLYLDNFNVAMFGGIQQRVGDFTKDGKTFKGIDKRSLYTLQLLSFLNRREVSDKYGNEMSLFYRSFHQLESTQTNFMVPSIYTPFVDKNGRARENGNDKIVTTLMNVVKQEYNRIQREWSTREQRRSDYELGVETDANVNKYNAELNSDGKTINVEKSSLRAYNFNVFEDFFSNPKYKDLGEQLVAVAKKENEEAVSFEAITNTKELKKALEEYANEEFGKFKQDLINENLIELNNIPINKQEKNPIEKLKAVPTTYYTSKLLPKFIKSDISKNAKTNLSSVYPILPGFDHTQAHEDIVPLEYMLYDYFMNHWKNALEVNQLMDGDIAMNVKNFQDYVKRLKKIVASGSNFKEGYHTVAYMNTITAFVHEDFPMFGPYLSEEEIVNDFSITDETLRNKLIVDYKKAKAGVEENVDGKTVSYGDMMREVFDGQSISTLMHQIDMHDAIGRVDERVIDILLAKNYRALTESEKNYLESKKVVNNAKKTVSAGRNTYHKNSEDYIDRLDVSRLIIEPREGETEQEATNRIFDELHAAYAKVYSLRRASHYLSLQDQKHPDIAANKAEIQRMFTNVIHQYYEPLPHREMLHDILNSMEYYQIDQLMDTTASKNATKVPIDIFNFDRDTNDYFQFNLSSVQVPNEDKYLQVETSGVKEKAKHSVQSKLLLPADLSPATFRKIIQQENAKRGTVMSEAEENAMLKVNDELQKYQISLGKAAKARLNYFKNVLREGNDFQVGAIYKMIRKSLEEQNAPTNTLKLFDLKPDGTPVFSPNLSTIRTTLEYYLLSQYSNNVTDEKTSGFKNFHVSGFGYNVMVDTQTNQVITTEQISQNPDMYSDKTRYKSRPLSVSVETQADGSKLYFAEVIMPKPYFENKQQEEFYMQNLTKMFGVRIPTEDKRSMLALKVVDFVDSSKLNNIIVPQFVHMLSGSDFDIDSLFGRMKSYYKNGKNEYTLFGDYSQYKSENVGKFIEFIHFIQKHDDFALALKAEKQRLIDGNTFELSDESPVFEILNAMKYNLGTDVLEFFDRKEIKSNLKDASSFTSYMFDLAKDAKELYVKTKLETEANPLDKDLAKERNQYGYEYAVIKDVKSKSLAEKRALRERLKIVDAAFEYQAALNVLAEFGMPSNVEAFDANPNYSEMVSMKYQNDNLDASIAILANEAVFKNLYINQRSSVQQFKNILKMFDLDLKTLTKKGNLYTPTNMILSKVENGMNKDGIGRTAVMNKFLSLASQYSLKLSDEQQIWNFIDAKGEIKNYSEFGQLNEDDQRVISIIGNILGMFADAAKDPIPAALQLNEINISTTLAMLGIGLKPEFAFGFNFLPGIRQASKEVQQTQFAITEDSTNEYKFYNNAIQDQFKLMFNNTTLMSDLINIGVIKYGSTTYNPTLLKENIKIEFEPKSLKGKDLNNLSPSQIGFKVSTAKGIELTDSQAEMVLMIYYWQQSQQTWAINRVANMTNLFKRLNPSLAAFDRHRDGIQKIKDGELFTQESVNRLFNSPDSVWKISSETLDDANEQFSKILLERSEFFSNVTKMFSKYFKEPKMFSNVITSYLGLSKFINTYPGSRVVDNEYMQDIIDEDDRILLESFTPEYWFTNNLAKELEELQDKYPKNEFLKLLKPMQSDKTATVEFEGKDFESTERFLQIMSRAKIKGEYANTIVDSIAALYNTEKAEERLFVKKLFYHELVRTGLLPKAGSFLQFMPTDLLLPISDNIEEFINYMKNATKEDKSKFDEFMFDYLGTNDISKVYNFFDELFNQIAYAAATETGNDKIPTFKYYNDKNNYDVKIKENKKEKNFNRTNINMFSFLEEGQKQNPTKKDLQAAKEKMIRHFFKMFGAQPSKDTDYELVNAIPLKDLLEEEFTMDLTQDVDKPGQSLSKPFGVKYDKDNELFEFPTLMKVADTVYVLQSTDVSASENTTSGKSLVKSFMGEAIHTNLGVIAKYKAIPQIYSSDKFSPLAFNAEQAEKYKSYTDKKSKIQYKKPGVENVKETPVAVAPKVAQISQQQVAKSEREYTPENITSLKPNEVFVFGANTAGGHGGGTAGLAQRGTTSSNYTALPVGTKGKWAEYGVVDKLMEGTEGKSFGIVTKAASISGTTLKIGSKRSVSLSRIEESINALIRTANENPDLKFLVTKFGTNMAGFSIQEMKFLLENKTLPNNIILPKEFEVRTDTQSPSTKQSVESSGIDLKETPAESFVEIDESFFTNLGENWEQTDNDSEDPLKC